MMLRLLIIALFAFSQCNGAQNEETDHEEIKKMLTEILEGQLNEIKAIHAEVEEIHKEMVDKKKLTRGVSLMQIRDDAPLPCLNLAKVAASPCPDFADVTKQFNIVFQQSTQIVIDGIKAFHETFRDPKYSCTNRNPFGALRCFLSAFRAAYDSLSNLKGEVTELKDSIMELYKDYKQFATDCESDESIRLKNQIIDLCKKTHSN